MNELEQLKAEKAELSRRLNEVSVKITAILTKDSPIKVGDTITWGCNSQFTGVVEWVRDWYDEYKYGVIRVLKDGTRSKSYTIHHWHNPKKVEP